MIDFHAHILPDMDDGSKSIEESLKMIEASFNQGVETIVATPHFYPWQEKPADFLARRERAIKSLPESPAKIRAGAEVAYYDGIDYSEDIEKLKIADTQLILIEMPMTIWTNRMLDSLVNLENRTRLKVVLAHFERYITIQKRTDHIRSVAENFLIQINANSLVSRSTQRKALKLFKEDAVDFIGSDCHNMTTRPPNMRDAYQTIEKKCGIKSVNAFKDKQNQYLEGGMNDEK